MEICKLYGTEADGHCVGSSWRCSCAGDYVAVSAYAYFLLFNGRGIPVRFLHPYSFRVSICGFGARASNQEDAEEYAKNDSRVKVVHKENGGHTSARNQGLKNATGEYVLFLDSDDWLATDVLEICKGEITKNNYPDIIVYQIYNTLTKECFINKMPDGYYERGEDFDKIVNSLLMDESGSSVFTKSLSGKVFKKSIIIENQLSIPQEVRIAEDAAAFVSAVIDSKSISVNSNARYYCVVREGSVSQSSDKDALVRLSYLFSYYKRKLQNWDQQIHTQFERYIISQLYTAVLLVIRSGENFDAINAELDILCGDNDVSSALQKAKFNWKGYKFIIKKFILRHRLWGAAKFLDRINI